MIRKNRIFFFILLVYLCTNDAWGGNYYIISFSEKKPCPGLFRKSLEPRTCDYLWIIPIDSLFSNSGTVTIYPFVIDRQHDYDVRGGLSYYWLDMKNYPSLLAEDPLYGVIKNNRRQLQSFSYSFFLSAVIGKTRVKVFLTPIKGEVKRLVSSFDNQIVFYSSEFELLTGFQINSNEFKRISAMNFIHIPYNAIGDKPDTLKTVL